MSQQNLEKNNNNQNNIKIIDIDIKQQLDNYKELNNIQRGDLDHREFCDFLQFLVQQFKKDEKEIQQFVSQIESKNKKEEVYDYIKIKDILGDGKLENQLQLTEDDIKNYNNRSNINKNKEEQNAENKNEIQVPENYTKNMDKLETLFQKNKEQFQKQFQETIQNKEEQMATQSEIFKFLEQIFQQNDLSLNIQLDNQNKEIIKIKNFTDYEDNYNEYYKIYEEEIKQPGLKYEQITEFLEYWMIQDQQIIIKSSNEEQNQDDLQNQNYQSHNLSQKQSEPFNQTQSNQQVSNQELDQPINNEDNQQMQDNNIQNIHNQDSVNNLINNNNNNQDYQQQNYVPNNESIENLEQQIGFQQEDNQSQLNDPNNFITQMDQQQQQGMENENQNYDDIQQQQNIYELKKFELQLQKQQIELQKKERELQQKEQQLQQEKLNQQYEAQEILRQKQEKENMDKLLNEKEQQQKKQEAGRKQLLKNLIQSKENYEKLLQEVKDEDEKKIIIKTLDNLNQQIHSVKNPPKNDILNNSKINKQINHQPNLSIQSSNQNQYSIMNENNNNISVPISRQDESRSDILMKESHKFSKHISNINESSIFQKIPDKYKVSEQEVNQHMLEVFTFYSKQHYHEGKRNTFDLIQQQSNLLNLGYFLALIRDLKILQGNCPVKKEDCIVLFKRHSTFSKDLTFEQFKTVWNLIALKMFKNDVQTQDEAIEKLNTKAGLYDSEFKRKIKLVANPFHMKERSPKSQHNEPIPNQENQPILKQPLHPNNQKNYKFQVKPIDGKSKEEVMEELKRRKQIKEEKFRILKSTQVKTGTLGPPKKPPKIRSVTTANDDYKNQVPKQQKQIPEQKSQPVTWEGLDNIQDYQDVILNKHGQPKRVSKYAYQPSSVKNKDKFDPESLLQNDENDNGENDFYLQEISNKKQPNSNKKTNYMIQEQQSSDYYINGKQYSPNNNNYQQQQQQVQYSDSTPLQQGILKRNRQSNYTYNHPPYNYNSPYQNQNQQQQYLYQQQQHQQQYMPEHDPELVGDIQQQQRQNVLRQLDGLPVQQNQNYNYNYQYQQQQYDNQQNYNNIRQNQYGNSNLQQNIYQNNVNNHGKVIRNKKSISLNKTKGVQQENQYYQQEQNQQQGYSPSQNIQYNINNIAQNQQHIQKQIQKRQSYDQTSKLKQQTMGINNNIQNKRNPKIENYNRQINSAKIMTNQDIIQLNKQKKYQSQSYKNSITERANQIQNSQDKKYEGYMNHINNVNAQKANKYNY